MISVRLFMIQGTRIDHTSQGSIFGKFWAIIRSKLQVTIFLSEGDNIIYFAFILI